MGSPIVSINKKSDGYFIVNFGGEVSKYSELLVGLSGNNLVVSIIADELSDEGIITAALQSYNNSNNTTIESLTQEIIDNNIFVIQYKNTSNDIVEFKFLLFKGQTLDFTWFESFETKNNSILKIDQNIRGLFHVVNDPAEDSILYIEDENDYPHIKNLTMGNEDDIGTNRLEKRDNTKFLPFSGEDDTCGYFLSNNIENIKLTNCVNYHAIGSKPNDENNNLNGSGGFMGSHCSNIILENCHNYGNIINNDCGGLVGKESSNENGICLVNKCKNNGLIIGINSGGVCGANCVGNAITLFIECENNGFIFGDNGGGIVGRNPKSKFIDEITGTNENIDKAIINRLNGEFGIEMQKTVSIVSCKNNGHIYGAFGGGIVGAIDGGSVYASSCINTGIVGKMTIPLYINTYIQTLDISIPLPRSGITSLSCGGIIGDYTIKTLEKQGAIVEKCKNTGIIGEINILDESIIAAQCGGIVGFKFGFSRIYSKIENCENYGTINAYISGGISGGLEGFFDGNCEILNCTNYGDIKGVGSGGLCGNGTARRGGDVLIKNCINYGAILKNDNIQQNTDGYSGGIVGSYCANFEGENNGTCTILFCENYGEILNDYSGGITGSNAGDINNTTYSSITNKRNGCIIQNCINNGPIKSAYSGGICGAYAGSKNGLCKIQKSINNADIEGSSSGGICGLNVGHLSDNITEDANTEFVVIEKCINNGELKGEGCGGICGSNTGFNKKKYDENNNIGCIIEECTNKGNIHAEKCGGIIGSFNIELIENSFITNNNINKVNGTISIKKCINDGILKNIKTAGITGYNAIGFLNYAIVKCCINNGQLLEDICSGIIGCGDIESINSYGEISNDDLKTRKIIITRCVNTGNVGNDNKTIKDCAGIIGLFFSSSYSLYLDNNNNIEENIEENVEKKRIKSVPIISECINRGNFNNVKDCSGIAAGDNGNVYIEDCINYGNMINTEDNYIIDKNNILSGILIGLYRKNDEQLYINIRNCINVGTIKNKNGSSFGIFGTLYNNNTESEYTFIEFNLHNCINYGNLNNSNISSGIVGSINNVKSTNSNSKLLIDSCYNLGFNKNSAIIYETFKIYNIITISNCYNLGRIVLDSNKNDVNNINLIVNNFYNIEEYFKINNIEIKNINNIKNSIDLLDSNKYSIGYPYPLLTSFKTSSIWSNYNNYDDVPILINISLQYQEFHIKRIPYEGEIVGEPGPQGPQGLQGEQGLTDPITTEILKSSTLVGETINTIKEQLVGKTVSEVGTFTLSSDPVQNNLLSGIIVEFFNKVNNSSQ